MATWTIMVYFAGDSSLGQEMIWALKALRETERPKGIKLVALFDGGGPPTTFSDVDLTPAPPRQAEATVSGSGTLGKVYPDTVPQQVVASASASRILAKVQNAFNAADTHTRNRGVDSVGGTL